MGLCLWIGVGTVMSLARALAAVCVVVVAGAFLVESAAGAPAAP